MVDSRRSLTPLAGALGNAVTLAGVLQSEPGLSLFGITCSAASATLGLFSNRSKPLPPGVRVEGQNLDSLQIANIRRRLNRSLTVERAFHVAIVDPPDLHIAWQYDGFCRTQRETAIEFSVDSENNVAFEDLDCAAFDLLNDPGRLRQIRPTLVDSDGVSKKISVPFLQPLALNDLFSVRFDCCLPGCVTDGVQYYTSSLSFDQPRIESTSLHLIFVKTQPKWVRAYECGKDGKAAFLSELRPFRDDGATCEYVDIAQDVPGQSVRVYLYDLQAKPARRSRPDRRRADAE
jgi:hypothetical protein